MTIQKIKIIFIFFISLLIYQNTYSHYWKYDDEYWKKAYINTEVNSERKDWYCYKMRINNPSNKNIYDWKIAFETDWDIEVNSKWWCTINKTWLKTTISWISWNHKLRKWDKNIEVWFCVKWKHKPKNIRWDDDTDDNFIDDNYQCTDIKDKYNCEIWKSQLNCSWTNNTCIKKEIIDNNTVSTSTGICTIEDEKINELNLVKNPSFEEYNSWNMFKKRLHKCINFFSSRFSAKFRALAYWTSLNWEYKIWRDNEDIKAVDWLNFLELTDYNSVWQNIQTKADKKYKLSFYTIAKDEKV